jgi:hypothetical protein
MPPAPSPPQTMHLHLYGARMGAARHVACSTDLIDKPHCLNVVGQLTGAMPLACCQRAGNVLRKGLTR